MPAQIHASVQQPLPGTTQRSTDANERCDQNRNLARLDLLNRAGVQIAQLCQTLLRHFLRGPLSTHIRAETFTI